MILDNQWRFAGPARLGFRFFERCRVALAVRTYSCIFAYFFTAVWAFDQHIYTFGGNGSPTGVGQRVKFVSGILPEL